MAPKHSLPTLKVALGHSSLHQRALRIINFRLIPRAERRTIMKAAIVQGAGQSPVYGEFAEPVPSAGESLISVTASAVSHLAKTRASGKHYSSSGQFPFVVGIDGVGRLEGGTRVYFAMPRPPYGSMAERTVVHSARYLPLPEGLDDVTAAAIANPGMSSWAAFKERAKLKAGETVLVNDLMLPAAVLRSSAIKLMGSGLGSVPLDRLVSCAGELLQATVPGGFKIEAKPFHF